MSGVTRLGQDSASGLVITGSTDVFVNGTGAGRIGDAIEPHDDSPHNGAVIVTGSSTVFVNGIPLARAGDSASCGHPLTGSDNVFSG